MNRLALILLSSSLAFLAAGCPGGGSPPPAKSPAKTAAKAEAPAPKKTVEKEPEKPFDRATLKTPWKDAKVGQWALYKTPGQELRFEVIKVEDRKVTWAKTDAEGNPQSEVVEDLAEVEDKYEGAQNMDAVETDKIETKKVKIGDKEIEVTIVKRKISGDSAENWITTAVPPFMAVGGDATAKSMRSGNTHFELIDFGQK